VNPELQVLSERFIELVKVIFVLGDFREQIHALLDDVLPNNLKNFVLLQRLTRDVER
jgi:hypothetical protein